MSTKGNKELIRKMFAAGMSAHKQYLAPNYVWRNTPMGDLNLEQGLQYVASISAAFPDINFIVKDQVAEGDKVVSTVTMEGTHKGTFSGIAPTGKKVSIEGVHIHRIEKGKIAEVWTYLDMLAMMTQLGAIPAPKK